MKRKGFFIIFIVFVLVCSKAYAFTAYYEQTISGTGIAQPETKIVKIKDNKIKMEIESSQGKTITIIDGMTMYSYNLSKNTAIKLMNKSSPGIGVLSDYSSYLESLGARIVGSEGIDSYECDIYEFIDPRLGAPSKVWLWKEENFPVKVETEVHDGTITTIMKNVKVGIDIDDSEFMLPNGIKIMDASKSIVQ